MMSSGIHALSAEFSLGGLTLGERITLATPLLRSYICKPSSDLPNYTRCDNTPSPMSDFIGPPKTLIYSPNGTLVFLLKQINSRTLDEPASRAEIEQLSTQFQAHPTKLQQFSSNTEKTRIIIATWGDVNPQALNKSETYLLPAKGTISKDFLIQLSNSTGSPQSEIPVLIKLAGGAGYVYIARFDFNGRGTQIHIAADFSSPIIARYEPALREILEKDKSLPPSDYSLWPEVALLTRILALDTSPAIANATLDNVFNLYTMKKLRSHVWSLLPLGPIDHLSQHIYAAIDVYNPKTEHLEIREPILEFLSRSPTTQFADFLYFVIGQPEQALSITPNSPIKDVLEYCIAHRTIELLLRNTAKVLNISMGEDPFLSAPVNSMLRLLNTQPELYNDRPLSQVIPRFSVHAAAARPYLQRVAERQTSPHRDDASYLLGWLAFHEEKFSEALRHLENALEGKNTDYKYPAAIKLVLRILQRLPIPEQIRIIEEHPQIANKSVFWYVPARSAYRDFDYNLAHALGERALRAMQIPIDRLPATSDPELIKESIEKLVDINSRETYDVLHIEEIIYLIEASRQIIDYQNYMRAIGNKPPAGVNRIARQTITKFSKLYDERFKRERHQPQLSHKDFRQALHLIAMTLGALPTEPAYTRLREWLRYRQIRILSRWDPAAVPTAIAEMEAEFPNSELMDDALAEQLISEGLVTRNISAAERTFSKLIKKFPKGNAVDNAYTWMAIMYHCAKQFDNAKQMDTKIIRLYPSTRHALYAQNRMSNPEVCVVDSWRDR